MALPTPQNEKETAYFAFGLVDELLDFLLAKGILSESDIDGFVLAVMKRFEHGGSGDSKRLSEALASVLSLTVDSQFGLGVRVLAYEQDRSDHDHGDGS